MKNVIFFLLSAALLSTACQKSISGFDDQRGGGVTGDSTIMPGDTLTYEVLTADPRGWFGAWNRSDGVLTCNDLDSITYGSPIYLPGGWRYTFVAPSQPFQALVSVVSASFTYDITANLYRNGELIKSVTNDAMRGWAKFMVNLITDSLTGTVSNPVLTYRVLVTDPDPSKFQSESWIGQWNTPSGVSNNTIQPLLLAEFAMPSGWNYTFRPDHLPFTMRMGASPYTTGGGRITINFFVNGQLVKTASARGWIYGMEYIVQ
jgi:hypothetical protein